MSIFNGSNEIGKIFYGSNEIGKVYYGSTLIWEAEEPWDDVEFDTAGTYDVVMPSGTYLIELVGAGGGGGYRVRFQPAGSSVRTSYTSCGGGSGGYTAVTLTLPAGTYTFTVGAGSISGNGGDTIFGEYSAGGGVYGLSGGEGGIGETLNGNKGSVVGTIGSLVKANGGTSVYPDTTKIYGQGAPGQSTAIKSEDGYVRITKP